MVKLLQVISTPRCAAFCQNRHERPLQSLPHAGSAGGRAGGGETAGGSAGGEMMRAGQQPSHAQPREFCRMEHVMPRSRKLWHCLPLHWARQDRTAGEEEALPTKDRPGPISIARAWSPAGFECFEELPLSAPSAMCSLVLTERTGEVAVHVGQDSDIKRGSRPIIGKPKAKQACARPRRPLLPLRAPPCATSWHGHTFSPCCAGASAFSPFFQSAVALPFQWTSHA